MAELTIYLGSKNCSSWSLRARLALRQAAAAFEELVILLGQPDSAANLRRVSPSGHVWVIQYGALTIWESLAIWAAVAKSEPW